MARQCADRETRLLSADAVEHAMGVLDGRKIEMPAPDEGLERAEIGSARVLVDQWTCLDMGRALPCAALGLVIALGRADRDADGRGRGRGAKTEIGAEDIAVFGILRQHADKLARDMDIAGARLHDLRAIEA